MAGRGAAGGTAAAGRGAPEKGAAGGDVAGRGAAGSDAEGAGEPEAGGLAKSLTRWLAVGFVFLAWGLGVLYLLKDRLGLPLMAATLVTAETGSLLRFLVNDRWVFGRRRSTWRRLWQYHVANAGSFVIWWGVSNALPPLGVHYLLAAVAATACSVGFSLLTNFLWIWRRRRPGSPSLWS